MLLYKDPGLYRSQAYLGFGKRSLVGHDIVAFGKRGAVQFRLPPKMSPL